MILIPATRNRIAAMRPVIILKTLSRLKSIIVAMITRKVENRLIISK
jgi:hypothetical protein